MSWANILTVMVIDSIIVFVPKQRVRDVSDSVGAAARKITDKR